MSKLEIACVIIGFCVVASDDECQGRFAIASLIIKRLAGLAMVLLPLYFNLWKS